MEIIKNKYSEEGHTQTHNLTEKLLLEPEKTGVFILTLQPCQCTVTIMPNHPCQQICQEEDEPVDVTCRMRVWFLTQLAAAAPRIGHEFVIPLCNGCRHLAMLWVSYHLILCLYLDLSKIILRLHRYQSIFSRNPCYFMLSSLHCRRCVIMARNCSEFSKGDNALLIRTFLTRIVDLPKLIRPAF